MELLFLRVLTSPVIVWILKTNLVSQLLMLVVPYLQQQDPLPYHGGDMAPDNVGLIYLVSYASESDKLTILSIDTTLLATHYSKQYPNAFVIGCEFRDNPRGASEWQDKCKLFKTQRIFCAGKATNTIDEDKLIMKKVDELGINLQYQKVIVVGNGAHIRRVRLVLNHYHPNMNFCFRCTDAITNDPHNPMKAQRLWQTWVIANLVGIPFYKLLGVEYFAKKNLSQPTD